PPREGNHGARLPVATRYLYGDQEGREAVPRSRAVQGGIRSPRARQRSAFRALERDGRRVSTRGAVRVRRGFSLRGGWLKMAYDLTEDQKMIVDAVREFVEREVIPVADGMEHADEYPEKIVEQMKEMGLFGMMVPEEYGGLGMPLVTYALTMIELSRGWMSLAGVLNTHTMATWLIKTFGTDEQKQRFLPQMVIGGKNIEKLGYKGVETTEIAFDDHRLPAANLLGGEEGQGFVQNMAAIEVGRVNVAARALGVAQRAFEEAIRYAQERQTFGKP